MANAEVLTSYPPQQLVPTQDIANVRAAEVGPEGEQRAANLVQVCLERGPRFYSRIATRMMHGSPINEGKPTFDEVTITGLGSATKIAISAAALLEQDQQGFIKRVETFYFTSSRSPRRLPKITIVVQKNVNAPKEVLPAPVAQNPISTTTE